MFLSAITRGLFAGPYAHGMSLDWMRDVDWLRWLSLFVAAVALFFSWRTFRRTRDVDRRNLFIEIHRLLLDPDLVRARRRLYKIEREDDVSFLAETDEGTLTHIYRVLALFDLLGYYAESGWVNREEVLEEWSDSLHRSRLPGRHVVAWRRRVTDGPAWPHYQKLAVAATTHAKAREALGPPVDVL